MTSLQGAGRGKATGHASTPLRLFSVVFFPPPLPTRLPLPSWWEGSPIIKPPLAPAWFPASGEFPLGLVRVVSLVVEPSCSVSLN